MLFRSRMAFARNKNAVFLVKRRGVDSGRFFRAADDSNIDLRARNAPGRQVCIDADNTELRPRHLIGQGFREQRQARELACIRDGQRELSVRRGGVEGVRLDGAFEFAQGTLQRGCQSGGPRRGHHSATATDDEWVAKLRAQARQRITDRGGCYMKLPCRAHDAPLRQYGIEHSEQVEIEAGYAHGW